MTEIVGAITCYVLTGIAEIAGCYSFWAWARLGKSSFWLVPGVASLILFAWLLTRIDVDFAGRAYAAYGGIYILMSLVWLWAIEGAQPSRSDVLGVVLCLTGTAVILLGGARHG